MSVYGGGGQFCTAADYLCVEMMSVSHIFNLKFPILSLLLLLLLLLVCK